MTERKVSRKMAPHRSNGRGTLRFDRVFPVVGRIALASGLSDRVSFRQVNDLLTDLSGAGRDDVLRLVRERLVTPRSLLAFARKMGPKTRLATISPDEFLPVREVLARWLGELSLEGRGSAQHRRNQEGGIARILKGADDRLVLSGLPELAEKYRKMCVGKPTEWNRGRAYLCKFVADTAGAESPTLASLRALKNLSEKERRREGRPYRTEGLRRLLESLDPEAARCARTMALTGFGPDELWNCRWVVREGGYIWIDGTKRPGRRRGVPLVEVPSRPTISLSEFRKRLARAQAGVPSSEVRQPYDLRRTYSVAIAQAGIPEHEHRVLMGHGPRNVTEQYQEERVITPARVRELRAYARLLQVYYQELL